jgi:2,3-bisphosphoglycerate-independent phosphoglycerate mutase
VRYVIAIMDGAADEPQEALEGRTPLDVARAPTLAGLAEGGRVGVARFTPPELAGDDWAWLVAILGADPRRAGLTGGAIRRAAWGCEGAPGVPLCVDLLAEGDSDETRGLAVAPGAIRDGEGRELIEALLARWRETMPETCGAWRCAMVRGGRALLVDESGERWDRVAVASATGVLGRAWEDMGPTGRRGPTRVLANAVREGRGVLAAHEVNAARREQGLRPATLSWVWGMGEAAPQPRHPGRVFLSDDEDARGVAALLGWRVVATDAGGLGVLGAERAGAEEVVCVHDARCALAGRARNPEGKVAAIERFDGEILGPVVGALEARCGEDWRVLVTPGRGVLCATGRADDEDVPFLMHGAWVRGVVARPMTEAAAAESDLRIDQGHTLLEYLMRSGLTGRRR